MKDKEIKLSEITNVDTLINYLDSQKFRHMKYSHYTDIDAMDSILAKRCLWLSPLEQCNDSQEVECAESEGNLFCLCFSAVYSENIPMWYLYGGITGQGVRLTFRNSVMNSWKDKFQFALKEYDKENNEISLENITPIDVQTRDVLYVSKDENNQKYRLKYNNQCSNGIFQEEDFKQIQRKYKGFYKELPWFYEKEFRILVKVDFETAQLLKSNSNYKLALIIDEDVYKESEILLGPESDVSDIERYPGIKQFLLNTIPKSQYTNKIRMKLLEKNKRKIVLHKEKWCKEEQWRELCSYATKQKWCLKESKKEENGNDEKEN